MAVVVTGRTSDRAFCQIAGDNIRRYRVYRWIIRILIVLFLLALVMGIIFAFLAGFNVITVTGGANPFIGMAVGSFVILLLLYYLDIRNTRYLFRNITACPSANFDVL